jgi:kynurenine formamidase
VLLDAAPAGVNNTYLDMSYQYDDNTMNFPAKSHPKTTLELLFKGNMPSGTWVQSYKICSAEHGGTHIDAPSHFREDAWQLHQIPFESLVHAPAVVINITARADLDPNSAVETRDLLDWEREYGRIPEGAVVFMLSGWGRYWGNETAYLGNDRKDPTALASPGFSEEAAKFLVERKIAGVAVDTVSLDTGDSKTYPAHEVLADANKYGIENTANIDKLPPSGAIVSILPIKIQGGTGGPVRIVAEFNEI